jgi:hypothetical protein
MNIVALNFGFQRVNCEDDSVQKHKNVRIKITKQNGYKQVGSDPGFPLHERVIECPILLRIFGAFGTKLRKKLSDSFYTSLYPH